MMLWVNGCGLNVRAVGSSLFVLRFYESEREALSFDDGWLGAEIEMDLVNDSTIWAVVPIPLQNAEMCDQFGRHIESLLTRNSFYHGFESETSQISGELSQLNPHSIPDLQPHANTRHHKSQIIFATMAQRRQR